MRAAPASVLGLLLAAACTSTIVPKSRIEPQERAAVELQGTPSVSLELPGSALDTDELDERFVAELTRELGRRRSIAPNRDRADALLAAKLISVALVEQPGDFLVLRITAAARVESGREDPGKARSPWHANDYESPSRPSADWSRENGKLLEHEVSTGFASVASALVASVIHSKQPEDE